MKVNRRKMQKARAQRAAEDRLLRRLQGDDPTGIAYLGGGHWYYLKEGRRGYLIPVFRECTYRALLLEISHGNRRTFLGAVVGIAFLSTYGISPVQRVVLTEGERQCIMRHMEAYRQQCARYLSLSGLYWKRFDPPTVFEEQPNDK